MCSKEIKKHLDFEDEAEYAVEEKLKDKFSKYKGITKSFLTAEWDKYDSIPQAEFSRIWVYDNVNKTIKISKDS